MSHPIRLVLLIVSVFAFCITAGVSLAAKGGKGGGGGGSSAAPPSVVIDAADAIANAITIRWVTPVPAAGESQAETYEVWYSESSFTDPEDEGATLAPGSREVPAYGPGTTDYFSIRELDPDTPYFIAVRAVAGANVSALLPGSYITVTTRSTALPNTDTWQSEFVVEHDWDNCCNTTSVQLDSAGNPVLAWVQKHNGVNTSGRIWYAYKDSGQWNTEAAFLAGDCQVCIMGAIHDFKTVPTGSPGSESPGDPAMLFSHNVPIKGRHAEEVVEFAWRQGANDWVIEEIVRGDQRVNYSIDGYAARFAFDTFHDGTDWVPTAAYITTPTWNDPITTHALMIAERSPGSPTSWPKTEILRCEEVNASSARIGNVRLRRDPVDGSAHAMVQLFNDFGVWALLMHRTSTGWEHLRTGWLDSAAGFAVDTSGNYYVAAQIGDRQNGTRQLVVIEDPRDFTVPADACDPPGAGVAFYDVADNAASNDTFDNGTSEGEIIGNLDWDSAFAVYLTGDDGISTPNVHIFQMPTSGNLEISEARVLSRCPVGWIRDAVDRIHTDGETDSRNFVVTDSRMAWAYNLNRSAGRGDWKAENTDSIYLATRNGNACQ